MIKVIDLKREYKLSRSNIVHALKGVNFEVKEGEMSALVGPSGSGKSTVLNILGGLDRGYEGEVMIDDKELKKIPSNYYRRFVAGTIFQQFYLVPSLNVEENITLPAVFSRRFSRAEIRERLDYLLKEVGLENRRHHRPKELSGGQAQRVAIARALLARPKLILADEPTGNLDSKTGHEIIDLLFKINEDEKTTMIIVTHDLDIIRDVKKKIMIKDGLIDVIKTAS